jgi:hypothetical protein
MNVSSVLATTLGISGTAATAWVVEMALDLVAGLATQLLHQRIEHAGTSR